MSSPSPKSESESPVTIALIDGSQRMRSLSSRPAYAVIPNGHAPAPWKCPSPSPARSHARSSLSMPRTRPGSTPNFSTQSCQVSGGGVCTGRPSRRASRSWYGAVRTTAVARSRSSSGTESGSNNRKSSPSSIAYDETSSGHHCSSSQSGCGDCQCQTPERSSRMPRCYGCKHGRANPHSACEVTFHELAPRHVATCKRSAIGGFGGNRDGRTREAGIERRAHAPHDRDEALHEDDGVLRDDRDHRRDLDRFVDRRAGRW